tara:strand:+ start:759 stop:1166 length:408 start_codon:yes stop_codon:yes gene_type:complete
MLSTLVFCLGLQLNSWFNVKDLKHLVAPRLEQRLRKTKIAYGNLEGYESMMLSSKKDVERMIVCSEMTKMHFFLQDTEERIRVCLWDGHVSIEDKKNILTSMVSWLSQTNCSVDHLLYEYEDAKLLTDVIESVYK